MGSVNMHKGISYLLLCHKSPQPLAAYSNHYLTVSVGQGSESSFTGLWLSDFLGCRQDVIQGCSHRRLPWRRSCFQVHSHAPLHTTASLHGLAAGFPHGGQSSRQCERAPKMGAPVPSPPGLRSDTLRLLWQHIFGTTQGGVAEILHKDDKKKIMRSVPIKKEKKRKRHFITSTLFFFF